MQGVNGLGYSYVYCNGEVVRCNSATDLDWVSLLPEDKTLSFNVRISNSKVESIELVHKLFGSCNLALSDEPSHDHNDLDDAIRNVQEANNIKNGIISVIISTDKEHFKQFNPNIEYGDLNVFAMQGMSLEFSKEDCTKGIKADIVRANAANIQSDDKAKIVLNIDKQAIITNCSVGCLCVSYNGCLLISKCCDRSDNIRKADLNFLTNILRENKIPFTMFNLRKQDLLVSKETFVFSIKNGIIPIVKIGERLISNSVIGKITQILQKKLNVF